MLFALHSIFWRRSFHFTSVSHQTLISKGHFQRDSYPFIISSCFHIMPDLFTNTNILPLSEVTTNTSFPVTQEFIRLTPSRILNSLEETGNFPFIQLPGHVNFWAVAKNKAATTEWKLLFDHELQKVINQ